MKMIESGMAGMGSNTTHIGNVMGGMHHMGGMHGNMEKMDEMENINGVNNMMDDHSNHDMGDHMGHMMVKFITICIFLLVFATHRPVVDVEATVAETLTVDLASISGVSKS